MDIRFDDRTGTVAVGDAVLTYAAAADGALDVAGIRLTAPTHEARSLAVARALLAPAPVQALCSGLRPTGGARAPSVADDAIDAVALWLAGADAEAVSFGDALAALLQAGGDVAGAVRLPARQFDALVAALAGAAEGDDGWETIRFDGAPGGTAAADVRARLAARLLRRGAPASADADDAVGRPAAWRARPSHAPAAPQAARSGEAPPASAWGWPPEEGRPDAAPAAEPDGAPAAAGAERAPATSSTGSTADVTPARRRGPSTPGDGLPAAGPAPAPGARTTALAQAAPFGPAGTAASPHAGPLALDAPAAPAAVAPHLAAPRRDAPSAPPARGALALVEDPPRRTSRAQAPPARPGEGRASPLDVPPSADATPARPAYAAASQWSDVAAALGRALEVEADLRGLSR